MADTFRPGAARTPDAAGRPREPFAWGCSSEFWGSPFAWVVPRNLEAAPLHGVVPRNLEAAPLHGVVPRNSETAPLHGVVPRNSRPGMRTRCAPIFAALRRDASLHPATARPSRFVGACIVVLRRAFRLGTLRGPSRNSPFSDARTRHAREIGALSRGVDGEVVAVMKPPSVSRMRNQGRYVLRRNEMSAQSPRFSANTTAAEESATRRSRNRTGSPVSHHQCAVVHML